MGEKIGKMAKMYPMVIAMGFYDRHHRLRCWVCQFPERRGLLLRTQARARNYIDGSTRRD